MKDDFYDCCFNVFKTNHMYSVLQLGKYSCGHRLSRLKRTAPFLWRERSTFPVVTEMKVGRSAWLWALGTLNKEVKIFNEVTNRTDPLHHTALWIRLGRSHTKIRSPARKIDPILLDAFTIIKDRICTIRCSSKTMLRHYLNHERY